MTSSIHPTRRSAPQIRHRRGGFTLIEMLVVIGIIILLMGLLMPAVNRAYKRAIVARMQADIQALAVGLEAYKSDMRDYPTIDYNDQTLMTGALNPGATRLCWALLAPGSGKQDGHGSTPLYDSSGNPTNNDTPGPGFTLRPKGQVYGPYVDASRFKIGHDNAPSASLYSLGSSSSNQSEPDYWFADRYGHPILYFYANLPSLPFISKPNGFVAAYKPTTGTQPPLYNFNDNPNGLMNSPWSATPFSQANALESMRLMLGDANYDGQLEAGETPATTHGFLLWSAGPDEIFGVDVTTAPAAPGNLVPSCDDATSFTQ